MSGEKIFDGFTASDSEMSQNVLEETIVENQSGSERDALKDPPVQEAPDDAAGEAAQEEEAFGEILSVIKDDISGQKDSMVRISSEIREIHKLYHNEFAGRLKTMQEELERYHEIDRGRVFDDILKEIARIYCDNEALLGTDVDEKVKKHIKYLFMDLEQLLESNGVMIQKSKPGDKRNNKFCQIVERVETTDPEKHDTVVRSKSTGFYTEKRPLIKELIDVYIYQAASDEVEERS